MRFLVSFVCVGLRAVVPRSCSRPDPVLPVSPPAFGVLFLPSHPLSVPESPGQRVVRRPVTSVIQNRPETHR
jgi:hypothetical protein